MINNLLISLLQKFPKGLLMKHELQAIDTSKLAIHHYVNKMIENPDDFFIGLGNSLINFGIKVLCAFIIYIIGAIIIKYIKKWMQKFFTMRNTEATIASFTVSIVTITLTVILIIISISALGINTTSIAALLAAGGMAVGMALSGTLQNFAGGIMILTFKPFKSGDHILSQGFEGFVIDVNIVSTKIRTFDNAIIIMPNGTLFNSNITNITKTKLRRLKWFINVAHGSDTESVKNIIRNIINSDNRILHPNDNSNENIISDPLVNLNAIKESSIEFYARAWSNVRDYWDIYYDINEKIYTELPKQGIVFPKPQMDIQMKMERVIPNK